MLTYKILLTDKITSNYKIILIYETTPKYKTNSMVYFQNEVYNIIFHQMEIV